VPKDLPYSSERLGRSQNAAARRWNGVTSAAASTVCYCVCCALTRRELEQGTAARGGDRVHTHPLRESEAREGAPTKRGAWARDGCCFGCACEAKGRLGGTDERGQGVSD
jgi:hypothetical protein